ncbi:MAG TPA: acetyl-CoA hydrolase/transferase C-terminal domain-containing protein [Gemmatimonadales bacterium]|nr:acetyl-CoA hydrolase/transferase C-terminal domain-containing protein [Gemmatimonadales bacterium]
MSAVAPVSVAPHPRTTWSEFYRSLLCTPEEALKVVRSGDRVYIHPGCAVPEPLVDALSARAPSLKDVEVIHLLTMGRASHTLPEMEGHFRHNAVFIGGNARKAVNEGRADYTPIFLGEIARLFSDGTLPIDVALIQVSPPDAHGFCSLGVGVDHTLDAARHARHVIAEVNQQMPRVHGDAFIHVRQLNAVVETSRPLMELHVEPGDDITDAIAHNVAELIDDGDTLQMGIGGIPDAVLKELSDRRALGVHTEMFADGIVDLIEAGVVTGERKSLHRGKVIAGFLLGTKRLFDFVHDNPVVELHPLSYTNDPFVIAQNDSMVAINSAIEIDYTGQVSSDSIGPLFYSGFGGQTDFIRGASRSRGGKPIIALPSTAKGGERSRIVPCLSPCAGVVTTRADVRWVVTEYGAAYLFGKTVRQRARALIDIAHPKFREELERAAHERKLL